MLFTKNGLANTHNVKGTYTMVSLIQTKVKENSEWLVAMVTVEQQNGKVLGIEALDVTHAVSGIFTSIKDGDITKTAESLASQGQHSGDYVERAHKLSADISIARIYDFVKNHNDDYESDSDNPTSFNPKPVNKVLLNKDFTPKVFYPALLRLKVEELINEKDGSPIRRDYILQNIEEESVSKRNRFSRPNHSEKNSSNMSISDLFSLVKEYDKDFNPKSVHELLPNKAA